MANVNLFYIMHIHLIHKISFCQDVTTPITNSFKIIPWKDIEMNQIMMLNTKILPI